MEEFVHEIATDGKVIRTVSKDLAHRLGLLHRVVLGEVRDESGNVVLVRQTPDRQDPGLLVTPVGGHVRAHESLESALRREAHEEIGITHFGAVVVGEFAFSRRVLHRSENHLFTVFRITADPKTFVLGPEANATEVLRPSELLARLVEAPHDFGEAFRKMVALDLTGSPINKLSP